MNYINPDVATVMHRLAASMDGPADSGGRQETPALPHSRIMIHQPSSGMQGQSSDMEIALKQTLEVKKDSTPF